LLLARSLAVKLSLSRREGRAVTPLVAGARLQLGSKDAAQSAALLAKGSAWSAATSHLSWHRETCAEDVADARRSGPGRTLARIRASDPATGSTEQDLVEQPGGS
jgi:hypothetical protein